ncbi:MAG: outer membrane beta-barrel domain-containing protein [Desulfatiglans sp.]|jgi:outer membrane beta-barrel protein|nr:outer membrane beta-barrel domain-containing protein [Desulfatiglans sp.]
MKTYLAIVVLSVFLFFPASNASGKDTKDEAKVYAVQNRIFHRDHEINFDIGYIANENFFHPFPIGFGYIFNLNENWGWEVARAQFILAPENDLKSDLETQFGVTPSEFAKPTFMIHSHLIYKPFYGKNAVLNKGVINHETYLFAGGGVVNYDWNYPEGSNQNSGSTSEMVPSASFGIGSKYFINEKLCINFEIRDIMNFWSDGMENRIYVGVGIGYRFNLKPRKVEKDETFEKLNRYLKKEKDDDI